MAQLPILWRLLSRSVDLIPWVLRDKIRNVPGLAALQRIILRWTLDGKEFSHLINAGPAAGLRMRIRMPDDKLYWTGTWENDVTLRMVELVRSGSVCYDIGGHRGFMAGIMALRGARTVYCFEPNPDNAREVQELARLNPHLNIVLMACAVGAQDGVACFSVMPQSSMGKLATSTFQFGAEHTGEIEVQVRSLDSLVLAGEIEPPAFVKIDIEGAELAALQGAAALIKRHRPRLLIEVHSFELVEGCRSWLSERGYELSTVERGRTASSEADFSVCHVVAVPR
jgi:FkbM family methyltransferase